MKRPSVPLPSVLGRALAELAIIVVGVLIALGAQSWWENRRLDDERMRVRAGVSADLDALLLGLASDTDRARTILSDIRWLLQYSPDYATLPDSVFNRRVTYALWEIPGSQPRLPAYDDLKGDD